jgi:hypothetical protein
MIECFFSRRQVDLLPCFGAERAARSRENQTLYFRSRFAAKALVNRVVSSRLAGSLLRTVQRPWSSIRPPLQAFLCSQVRRLPLINEAWEQIRLPTVADTASRCVATSSVGFSHRYFGGVYPVHEVRRKMSAHSSLSTETSSG